MKSRTNDEALDWLAEKAKEVARLEKENERLREINLRLLRAVGGKAGELLSLVYDAGIDVIATKKETEEQS